MEYMWETGREEFVQFTEWPHSPTSFQMLSWRMMKKDKQPGGYSQGSQKEMEQGRNSSQGEEQKHNQCRREGVFPVSAPTGFIITTEHLQLYPIPLPSPWGFYCLSHACFNIPESVCVYGGGAGIIRHVSFMMGLRSERNNI